MIAVLKSTIIWQYKARFDMEEYIHVGISNRQILPDLVHHHLMPTLISVPFERRRGPVVGRSL